MADSVEVQEGEQSFAAIQKPHEADGEDQLILLWGRFWSDSESKAGAFYNQFNSDQHNIGDLRFVLHEDRSRLDPYDPDQSPTEMKNSLPSDPETGAGIPGAETQMFEQAVRKSLNDREKLKSLKTMLMEKNRDALQDWSYELISQYIKKGDLTFQVKGQLSTRSVIERTTPSADESSQDEGAEATEDAEEDDRNYRPVSIATSPMNGDFPKDLSAGTEIFVRATGPIVDKLPEELVDDRYDQASEQLEATVIDSEHSPNLPADFDGDPDDYWSVKVRFLEDEFGEGFVHKDEQIKPVHPDTEESADGPQWLSPAVLITSGVTILGIVGLAYLIFG